MQLLLTEWGFKRGFSLPNVYSAACHRCQRQRFAWPGTCLPASPLHPTAAPLLTPPSRTRPGLHSSQCMRSFHCGHMGCVLWCRWGGEVEQHLFGVVFRQCICRLVYAFLSLWSCRLRFVMQACALFGAVLVEAVLVLALPI